MSAMNNGKMSQVKDAWNNIKPNTTDRSKSVSDEKPSDDSSLRKLIKDQASQSNINGISFIISDKSGPAKFFYALAFLGLLALSVYQLLAIWNIFLSNQVRLKVENEFNPLPFPAITLCNMNIVRHSKINELDSKILQQLLNGLSSKIDSNIIANIVNPLNIFDLIGASATTLPALQTTLSVTSSTTSPGVTTKIDDNLTDTWNLWDLGTSDSRFNDLLMSLLETEFAIYHTFKEEYIKVDRNKRKRVGHQLKNMLMGCQFNGRKCDVKINDVSSYDYGNCFTLQSPKFVAGSTGARSGIVLTINLEIQEIIEVLTEGFGMRVVIHEPQSFPLPLEAGVTLSGGFETSIALKMTKIERKDSPRGACIDLKEYFNTHGIRYSTQACIQQCWEKLTIAQCGCQVGNVDSEISRILYPVDAQNLKGCFELKDLKCSIDARKEFLTDIKKFCNCPPPCHEYVYTSKFSGHVWPHKTKLNELTAKACDMYRNDSIGIDCQLQNLNVDSLSKNFLKINIYFEDLNYEVLTEEPLFDITQLISDVGGSLGLSLGVSLMCFCEVLETLVMVVVVLFRKLRRCTTVSVPNEP